MHRAIICCLILLFIAPGTVWSETKPKAAPVPESFYHEIQHEIEGQQAPKAIARLKPAIQEHPRDLRLRNLLGLAYTSAGQLKEANVQFQAALARDSRFVPALRNLAINEESLGNHKEAIEHFKRVLMLHPKDPVANAYVGSDRFVQRDYVQAYQLLSEIGPLAQNPTLAMEQTVSKFVKDGGSRSHADVDPIRSIPLESVAPSMLLLAATAIAQAGDYADAVRFFRQLPASWQSLPDVTYDLGLCLIRSEQNAEAIRVLESFLNSNPHSGRMLSLIAEAYAANNQAQKAIDSLREATLVDPKVVDNYIDLAELCTDYAAYDVGIQVLNVGIRNNPDSDRLYFEKGVIEAMKRDFASADRDLEKAQELAPAKSMAGLALGVQMMQTGKLPQAIHELRAKARQHPNDSVLQYMLGLAILHNGAQPGSQEWKDARASFEKAIKSDPAYEPPLVALARLNTQEKDYKAAHTLLVRAVSLAPSDSSALSQLAIVDHRMGLKEDASKVITQLAAVNKKQRNNLHRLQISVGPPQ